MEQMQAFIEKAKSDSSLMAKLDELGAAGAEGIVALAAEYGFTVTVEDCREAAEKSCPHRRGELAEEDLDDVDGGATQNRYDPKVCCNYTKVDYRCVGFLCANWCDHYRRSQKAIGVATDLYTHQCVMGRYNYTKVVTHDDPSIS